MAARSLTGRLNGRTLGLVLPHEHLVIDYGQMLDHRQDIGEELRERCLEVLHDLRSLGVGTVVDCTPPGYGRDLDFLTDLSRASGVGIVASTGSFCEQWHPQPPSVAAGSVEDLTSRFVDELTAGDTGCGIIKVATSAEAMTANEEKLLVAASAAHRATGAAMVSHTTSGLGLEQLDLYTSEGVDLGSVLISHVCSADEPPEYAVDIAGRGAYVGFDRLGHDAHDIEHWADLVMRMHHEGLADRVLLSHDSVQRFTGPEDISRHTFSDPTFLIREFLPFLDAMDVPQEVQHQMTHDNPRRWLLGGGDPR